MKDKDKYHRYHIRLEMPFSSISTMPDSPYIYGTIKFFIISWLRFKKKQRHCYLCQSLSGFSLPNDLS